VVLLTQFEVDDKTATSFTATKSNSIWKDMLATGRTVTERRGRLDISDQEVVCEFRKEVDCHDLATG